MLPEVFSEDTLLVVYDLGEAFEEATADRRRWGQEHTDVYFLGLNHIVLAFRPGADAEAAP